MTPERASQIAEHFDLRDLPPDFYADPYPVYAALHRSQPVRRMPDASYFLTHYTDLVRVYRDADIFSSNRRVEFGRKYNINTFGPQSRATLFKHHATSRVFNGPPMRTRVR